MKLRFGWALGVFAQSYYGICFAAPEIQLGGRLPQTHGDTVIWWAPSSAAKIRPTTPPLEQPSSAVQLRCAQNEWESVQVLIRPGKPIHKAKLQITPFAGPANEVIPTSEFELLQALYLNVAIPSDKSTEAGLWPDPLVPLRGAVNLEPSANHSFWIRARVARERHPGVYRGVLRIEAEEWNAAVPVELTVYDFALPDRMTCQTAFGFSPGEIFRYQHLETEASRRQVLDKYWADLSAHHISPYDPAPLDGFRVTWPKLQPPKGQWDDWSNLRLVQNEYHSGKSALLIYDDKPNQNVVVSYAPFIAIPSKGLHLTAWYRTAIPGHRFTISLNHYDNEQKWMSGRNKDFIISGNGQWQKADYFLAEFPPGAKYARLNLMATAWTDEGENQGLVWFDDVSLRNAETGEELVQGGDFERRPRVEPVAPKEQLQPAFDFGAWDKAMTKALDTYHFNSFSVPIPGLGGGTFHELVQPGLLGFGEDSPEYPLLLSSYCGQLEAHLRAKKWLSEAYVYWFDEPSEDQYAYLQNGFNKLKRYCPEIPRMITKLVEPGLIGGPNLWCPISDQYQPERAQERRKLGERFWWYVCTGPKAPYAGLFLDHPAPEMRIWLWQTFQRDIDGILVWQCNYWNSDTAYPDAGKFQDPYADPMSWTSGYGTPPGKRIPWGNGDGRFIYPPQGAQAAKEAAPVMEGPVDSIRWEQLRDGIEDYEYLTILRRSLTQRRANASVGALREYEALLVVPDTITRSMTEFARDGGPIEMRRHQIARAIESLK